MKKILLCICLFFLTLQRSGAQNFCVSPAPYSPLTGITTGGQMCFADFNGDGKRDFASIGFSNGIVSIFLSTGNGFAAPLSFTLQGPTSSILTDDFTNDGKQDLVLTLGMWGNVALVAGNGDGTFGTPVYFLAGTFPCAAVSHDFNKDGYKDLAVSNYSSNTVSVFMGNGTTLFPSSAAYTLGTRSNHLVKGDFDNDSQEDLAVGNGTFVTFLKGSANGVFSLMSTNTLSLTGSFTGMFADADNKLDLVGESQGDLCVYKNNGNFSFSPTFLNVGLAPYFCSSGDLNSDGQADLVTVGTSALTTVKALLNTGGMFTPAFTYTASPWTMFFSAYAVDLNNDTKNDIILGMNNTADLNVWLNCNTAVGINELSPERNELKIYPVPAQDQITLTFGDENAPGNFSSVSIYNGTNQLIREESLQEYATLPEGVKIQVRDLEEGFYLVQLRGNKGESIYRKFVISR